MPFAENLPMIEFDSIVRERMDGEKAKVPINRRNAFLVYSLRCADWSLQKCNLQHCLRKPVGIVCRLWVVHRNAWNLAEEKQRGRQGSGDESQQSLEEK